MKNSNDTSWDRTSDLPILLLYLFLNSDGQCGVRTGHPGLDYEQGRLFLFSNTSSPAMSSSIQDSEDSVNLHKTGRSKREYSFFQCG